MTELETLRAELERALKALFICEKVHKPALDNMEELSSSRRMKQDLTELQKIKDPASQWAAQLARNKYLEEIRTNQRERKGARTMTPDYDVDAELDAWYDANYGSGYTQDPIRASHRCPIDMPPCPDCEELYEAEDERDCI